jgi:hypothetical protein
MILYVIASGGTTFISRHRFLFAKIQNFLRLKEQAQIGEIPEEEGAMLDAVYEEVAA